MAAPSRTATSIIVAVVLALGLAAAGWFAAGGMERLRAADRYVTVKGSAEQVVDADRVVWPLPHTVGGNDLATVQRELDVNTAAIRRFFLDAGFSEDEIVVSPPRLEDRWAWAYGDSRPPERYRYSTTVSLRTDDVPRALEAVRNSGQLVSGGVMIGEGSAPEFDYTRLNDIKPGLIAEATAAARDSAEQFAKDSGSRLGGIRSANQGVVAISDRDQSSPHVKRVRVVTTVEYFLRD
ncbi:SIMPL domain-containing protein [Lysobacter sp. GX 14042]|uniref:SIMPL domain-containing protein n=1 Tax=Lysobacter sp. GX 14042 TaxID=2907155 RepID=UPI001F28357E|nr:SIMPL domain-containing protein [Lysobacter sp. GX 14042]MCE7031149.1 SIMPL domain-containing protein [Lysobacter sp. GX 14042]